MKWPFVRRSKYKLLEDQIEIYRKLHDEYAQINHDYMIEISRVEHDLANELNSHRETKEQKNELSAECDRLYDEVDNLKKELKETKDALKIAQEDNKKLHKVNNECWDAAIIFVDSINLARTEFMKDK